MFIIIYDIFAAFAVVVGLYSGISLLPVAFRNFRDRFLFVNILVLAIADMWVAGVYALMLIDVFVHPEILTIGAFTRPAMLFLLLIPYAIIKRIGI
jgi:hypothetical protein